MNPAVNPLDGMMVAPGSIDESSEDEHCLSCHCTINVERGRYTTSEGSYCNECFEKRTCLKTDEV